MNDHSISAFILGGFDMFEYFNFLSGTKSISFAGIQLHPLALVAAAAGVVAIMLYALLKMTR